MFSLILTDFDGTLIPKTSGELSKEFAEKIVNLTDRGVIFAVNSGRPYGTLKKLMSSVANRTLFICNDGAQIMYKNCLLYKNPISADVAKEIALKALALGLTPFAALREKNAPVTEDILSRKGIFGEDIFKLVLIKENVRGDLSELKELAKSRGLRACFEDNDYLEFCVASANKGTATEFVKQKFGISCGVVAFGDTKADYLMFNQADEAFIPKDAKDVCYPGAKFVDSVQEFIINEF